LKKLKTPRVHVRLLARGETRRKIGHVAFHAITIGGSVSKQKTTSRAQIIEASLRQKIRIVTASL